MRRTLRTINSSDKYPNMSPRLSATNRDFALFESIIDIVVQVSI